MSELPIHEQKLQLLEQILAQANRAHEMDERESMTVMTLDEATEYWDRLAPDAKNAQVILNQIEAECYIRRSERIAQEPASEGGRPRGSKTVSPGEKVSKIEKSERSRMRVVGKQSAAARQYVETERKANRPVTRKGIVRHVQKVAAPRQIKKVEPTQPKTERPGHEHLATLAKVADGKRRTDQELERVVGNVLNYLKWFYLVPWVVIDRTSVGTTFTIDQELMDICEGKAPRPVLNGFSIRGFLKHLRSEIIRRRKENNDERYRRKWSVDSTLMVEQTAILDWIEAELDRVP